MNILRARRKSKLKIRFKTLVLFIFSLIMTTFAWFTYSKVLHTTIDLHVASWDMEYSINGVEKENPIAVEIPILYPAMPEEVVTIDIKNNGERLVDIVHSVKSVTILGVSYELVEEGNANTTEDYITIVPAVLETDADTGKQIYTGAITNDITKFPFTIELEHSAQVQPGGTGYLKVIANWIGDNSELDSDWGYRVGEYLTANPSAQSVISIELVIDAYQAEDGSVLEASGLPSTTETKPFLPTGFTRLAGTNLETGLVIKDASGNQYVWVEVPKTSEVYVSSGLNITTFSETEYTSIYNDLKTYSGAYAKSGYTDDYLDTIVYRAVGLSIDAYNELKYEMLKSVYQNGGFYIGRYETGKTDAGNIVIQANTKPYTNITCSQAQGYASTMASGSHTTSLLFGIQSNLVMKYLQTKGELTEAQINSDSSSWGNYYSNTYEITDPSAQYNIYNASALTSWANAPYTKPQNISIQTTTGASSLFSRQNISDLAGNVWEWTLEYSSISGSPCTLIGGPWLDATKSGASTRQGGGISAAAPNYGFRVTMY